MKKILAALLMLELCSCATARGPASIPWRTQIHGGSMEELLNAERAMEKNDYYRYTEGVWRVIDKNAGSDAPTDLEREFVTFYIGAHYLYEREMYLYPKAWPAQAHEVDQATAVEGSQVYMRKLQGLPKLHAFSRLYIARVQELDGFKLPSWVGIPAGADRWRFLQFVKSDGAHVTDDVRGEYKAERGRGVGAGVVTMGCPFLLGILTCAKGWESDEQRTIKDLRDGEITLQVFKDGKVVW